MSDTFAVNQDGYVTLPKLGSIRIQDTPAPEAELSIRRGLEDFLINPSIVVQVLRRISVLGEVRTPGIYWADLTMRLPDLVAMAGGPTDLANANRITVIREGQRIEFSGRSQVRLFETDLQSGDQIVVHQKNFFARNPWATISTGFGVVTLLLQLGLL